VAESTVTSPLFLRNAEDLIERLGKVEHPAAVNLIAEAREIAAIFGSWGTKRPEDAARVAAIQRLFDIHRRAMDLLTKAGPPSAPSPGRRLDDEENEEDEGPRPVSARWRRPG
jgi:hypothetical protein